MSLVEISETERRIADRVDTRVTGTLAAGLGGASFESMTQVMEFAKLMSVSNLAIPKHLRGNPGACLAITLQALEWRMSPFAVANKSYSVNDRIAYESQLVQAVILQRAPIKGRFRYDYAGQGESRACTVTATLADGTGEVSYTSPPFGKIQPKNSPLWKIDHDQQQAYYTGRAFCRRYFPDVLLGIYDLDEIEARTVDVAPTTPAPRTLEEKLDVLAGAGRGPAHDPQTGEITDNETAAGSAPAAQDAGAETSQQPTSEAVPASTPSDFPGDLPNPPAPDERHTEALAWAKGFDEAAAQAKR